MSQTLMAQESTDEAGPIKVGKQGGWVKWKLEAETDPDLLLAGLKLAGFDGFQPNTRTWLRSLKDALRSCYTNGMVRSLKEKEFNGYTCVKEIKGVDENDFPRIGNAKIDQYGVVYVTAGTIDRGTIQDRTDHYKRVLPADAVSQMLVKIVTGPIMQGKSLTDNGGLYFVPFHNKAKFEAIKRVVEDAACEGTKNRVRWQSIEMDGESVDDLLEDIAGEITTETDRIMNDLTANEHGDRALDNRIDSCVDLRKRVETYEKICGQIMTASREAIKKTAFAAVSAKSIKSSGSVFAGLLESE